jgi:hypothetical protein
VIDGIEPYYRRIAASMMDGLPRGWSAASFEARFFPGSSVYHAEFNRKDGVARSLDVTSDGPRAFRELRALFKSADRPLADRPLWGQARFELRPDGTFNMTWGYEGCDAEGNCHFDEDEEFRRRQELYHRLTKR